MALYSVQTNFPPAAADLNQVISLLSGTTGPLLGSVTVANRIRAQLTGATATSGLVGMTAGGAPTSGTFAAGDLVTDTANLVLWVCTAGGTPGTWTRIGGQNTCGGLTISNTGQPFVQRSGRAGFDVVLFDAFSRPSTFQFPGSSTTSAAITLQYSGVYLFTGSVSVGGGTGGADIGVMLLKNGQPYQFGSQFLGFGTPSVGVSSLINCAVNDVIQLGVYTEGVYSVTLGYANVSLVGIYMAN